MTRPLAIAIASLNVEKQLAVEQAFRDVFCLNKDQVNIKGYASDSGINGGQPFEAAGTHHACTSRMASLQNSISESASERPDFVVVVENGITTLQTPTAATRYLDVPEVWITRTSDGAFHLATGVGREIRYDLLKKMELEGRSEGERGRMIAMDFQQRGLADSRYESIYAAAVMCLRQFSTRVDLPLQVSPVSPTVHKSNKAVDILRSLVGKTGVWASAERYKYQNWTRDFVLCTSWAFTHHPKLKNLDIVGKHLLNLARLQSFDGHVPIVFPDNEAAMVRHMEDIESKTGKAPHALTRYRNRLQDFLYITPNTRDSELLYILAAQQYLLAIQSSKAEAREIEAASLKAWNCVRHILPKDKDEFVLGGDWRDTCYEMDDKPSLVNACLLYNIYRRLENPLVSTGLKIAIQEQFWNREQGFFCNYPKSYATSGEGKEVKGFKKVFAEQTPVVWNDCDRLGTAYAILFDIATPDQAGRALKYLTTTCMTKHGIGIGGVYLPPKNDAERAVIKRDRNQIWPFVHNKIVLALIHHQRKNKESKYVTDTACTMSPRELFEPMVKLDGFYEWYDMDGTGHGSPQQTWSVSTFLEVEQALKEFV